MVLECSQVQVPGGLQAFWGPLEGRQERQEGKEGKKEGRRREEGGQEGGEEGGEEGEAEERRKAHIVGLDSRN